MTAHLPEPLPHGVLAGRDVLASRTVELARQQQPAVVWQRATAAGTVPVVRGGTLIAGKLNLDIRTGHARAIVPAADGSGYGDDLARTGTDQPDGGPSWAHLASADGAVVLTRTTAPSAAPEFVVAVHDRETGRRLWQHQWPDRDVPGARAADVRGGAVLTREGAFIRARRLRDGELLWSAVPPPRYGWFGDAGRHPASQWARLPHPEAADLFIHAPTGRTLSIAGTFHHTGDDLVLAYDGHLLACLALPGSPHRPAPAPESAEPDWIVNVGINPYLPPDGDDVSAIVTVTMAGSPPPPTIAQAALVFLIDVSAAMDEAWLAAAQEAVAAALGRLRTGTLFAIVAGAEAASMVYPAVDQLAVAGPRTLAAARRALSGLTAGTGGIAVGRWLSQARLLLQPYPEAVRQAQLLVAGVSGESAADLTASIAHCEGIFRCDCRGVGTNWEVAQLRRISGTLLGTVDIVVDPRGLAADVAALTESAMARTPGDVHLRLHPAEWARVRFVKQIAPVVDDLTSRWTSPPDLPAARDYPAGAWQPGESRDYHVALDVTPGDPGVPIQACRVSAVLTESSGTTRELAGEAIQVEWVAEPNPMNRYHCA